MPQVGPLKLKAQLLCGGQLAMGPGKADLLEAIAAEGSISAAGRRLGMSYRRAWLLVDMMNRCWSRPLVEAVSGGGRRKGARLTDAGHEVLAAYRALEAALVEASAPSRFEGLGVQLLDEPRPSQHEEGEGLAGANKG